MKKGYFKIVSVILIIALLIQSIPITAFAQETAEGRQGTVLCLDKK